MPLKSSTSCCGITTNHEITNQRYKESNRHTPSGIRNIPHNYWCNRTTHYRHDEQGGGKLGLGSCIPQCQRENGREHDTLSQIQGEECYEG